jgi:dipeptidyl-peptidase-4
MTTIREGLMKGRSGGGSGGARRRWAVLALAAVLAPAVCGVAGGAPPAAAAKDGPKKKVGWIEPVKREMEGWTVWVDPQLLEGPRAEAGGKALRMLANHLQRISILAPEKQLRDLRRMEIWIEHEHPELRPMQYHPDVGWLTDRGYDPRLAKKVHVTRAAELLSRDQMLKHPAVILHELAHAYHDQILGFEEPGILDAYRKAMEAGIYDKVLLYDGNTVRHYAATDHKEYFAEATEAYFYRNDFYPFVRAELRLHDPAGHALMERIWGKAR